MNRVAKTSAFFRTAVTAAALLQAGSAQAIGFNLDYGDGVEGTLNTVVTAGAAVRMQNRSSDLVGKGNLGAVRGQDICGPQPDGSNNQQCQGVFSAQTYPAAAAAAAPGQATLNADDGNWNYDKHDLTQAVFKITQDLKLTYADYGFFAKWMYFFDAVNNDFEEFHPNMITSQNREAVAYRGDERANTTFSETFGRGAPVRRQRRDGKVLEQIGTGLQLFDAYFYGTAPLPEFLGERELTFKLGRQTLNWGESTALVFNSLNQANPINANNFFRVGFDLSELFTPVGMAFVSTEVFEGAAVEAFYSYEWSPLEIPAPGSFYSFADVGSYNTVNHAGINFGTPAEDPEICGEDCVFNPESGLATPLDNPLSGLTPTSTTIRRLQDNNARDGGEFGLSFKYFAEWLNNGTEIGLYFMNYHSKLPYISFYSTPESCARDATNGIELLELCPDMPVQNAAGDPRAASDSAVPIDSVKFQFEYPEDIQMFGVSFNTTVGELSLQGEIAYRPDMPLQVDLEDLTFHALGPMLARCHDEEAGCTGSQGGLGPAGPGGVCPPGAVGQGSECFYPSSDFSPYPGTGITAYPDTFDLAIGAAVGSARSFPSFVGSWRGVQPGETPGNSYIRGWENFDVYQFNLGATYVQGATDNPIGADQLIWLFELGAQLVPEMPDTDQLQIEAFGTFNHASAGADGSMTGNYSQDCAHTIDCNFGADGLRFNPHQENAKGYADPFSFGYVIVSLIRYESVFPGISFAPFTIWKHDVKGTSADVANQFVESRKTAIFLLETRYKEALSLNLGYTWFTGGGRYNAMRDRDQALAYVKYQF